MLKSTHRRITRLIGREIRNTTGKGDLTFKGSVYADNHRKEIHPLHPDIGLNRHHDIEVNRIRIKKLIFYAKKEYQEGDIKDATFDYCNAFHFICDSVIPALGYGRNFNKYDLRALEQLFDIVEIDPSWNSIEEIDYEELEIERSIERFLSLAYFFQIYGVFELNKLKSKDYNGEDTIAILSELLRTINAAMKYVYKTGLITAKFVFNDG